MTNDTYMFAMVQHWTNRKASNPWIDDLDGMCTYGFHAICPNMSFVDHIFDLNMIWACRTLGQHTTTIHITRTNTHAHSFSCHVHLRSGLRHHMSSDYSCFLLSTIPYYTDYTVLEILKRHTTNSLPHWNSSWPL